MRTININGKEYPIIFNALAVVEFTKKQGGKGFADMQKHLSFLQTMTTDVSFDALEKVAQLIHCAVAEGCEEKQQEFDITERQIYKHLLTNPDSMLEMIAHASDEMTGEQKPGGNPAVKKKVKT